MQTVWSFNNKGILWKKHIEKFYVCISLKNPLYYYCYCKTKNIEKKEKLLLKLQHRLTNIRKNHLHQATSEIINRKPRFICIEDLNVSGMMKNKHLSKAVQNQCFFEFRRQLEYKCREKGIPVVTAEWNYPSSKLCSCCGKIKKDLKLSERVYRCDCGNVVDRDL